MAEFELIDWVKEQLRTRPALRQNLPLGPGDDAAVIAGGSTLFAADMLMEGVHFDLRTTSPELAGRKALAVNLSDIAAMAGTPTSITVCLALPRRGGEELGRKALQGLFDLACDYQVAIAGGDTNAWDGPLVISVAILGSPHARGSVTRGGAAPGDQIFVTGPLGGSLGGRHLTFAPRVQEARTLHERYGLTAMIDLSDGLGSDLRHILKQSSVGAVLDRALIPVHGDVPPAAGAQRLQRALSDGEDFELCFTVPPAAAAALLKEQPLRQKVHLIGTVAAGSALLWQDGSPIVAAGYVHDLKPSE